jgi:hypothetical protein
MVFKLCCPAHLFPNTPCTSFSKIKSPKEVTKKTRFFLLFFACDRRIHTSDRWIRIQIQEAQKHTDLVDPDLDPQHWSGHVYTPQAPKLHLG